MTPSPPLVLGLHQLVEAGEVHTGVELLPAGDDIDTQLALLRVHEDHAVGVFHQHIAVGAHMELGDLLFIVVPQVYQQAQPTALGQLASQHQAQRFILHLHLGHLLALLGGRTKHLGYLAVPDAEGDLAILPQHYHIIYRSLMAVGIGL